MSKTFGQLKAGDEVYIIKGSDVEIVKVQGVVAHTEQMSVFVIISDLDFLIDADISSFYGATLGDIYCDIDDAMRKMQDICAKALHDYKCASGALNLLETKKKKEEKK